MSPGAEHYLRWTRGDERITLQAVGGQPVRGDSRIRSFVAVDVDASVRTALRGLLAELGRSGGDVRWVHPEGMHITLKFLGWVEAALLERVRAALAVVVPPHRPVRLHVAGLGAFPSLHRPRVLWVGLTAPGLADLATHIDAALAPLEFARETRAFTPHLTLGRVGSLRGWTSLETLIQEHLADEFGESRAEVVSIYRSTLHSDGAVYTPLWTIPLTGNKGGAIDDARR